MQLARWQEVCKISSNFSRKTFLRYFCGRLDFLDFRRYIMVMSSGATPDPQTNNNEDKMNTLIANLEARLQDIPGDMCETKARYIENSEAFLATLTNDEALIRSGIKFLLNAEMIADIRDEGAGVWEFWESEGMLAGIRNRALAAMRA